jgi:hypothetical protein
MKLDPSIIALKDFENIKVFRLKLARYSTANKAPSINASEWALFHNKAPNFQFIYNMTPNVIKASKLINNIYSECKQKMMPLRGQDSWAKMTSLRGKLTAPACHP